MNARKTAAAVAIAPASNVAAMSLGCSPSGDDALLQITAGPEPESYAVVFCGPGLAGLGLGCRQRRQQAERLRYAL